MAELRHEYRDQLAEIERRALAGLDMVVVAVDRALQALQERDAGLANAVVADDDRIDDLYLETHEAILSLLALQAPVAGDLRLVASLLHVIRHVERMGDQCVTIAKLVPLDARETPVDRPLLDVIARMGRCVRAQVLQAQHAFTARSTELAERIAASDLEVNALNREAFARGVAIGGDPALREWAMHMTLAARCIERIGDNAVDVGEQAAFVETGRFREFSDASQASSRRR